MNHGTVWEWIVHGFRSGWWLWLILAIALVVFLAWLFRRSGNGRK